MHHALPNRLREVISPCAFDRCRRISISSPRGKCGGLSPAAIHPSAPRGTHTKPTHSPYSAAPARAGAVHRVPGPVPPAAWADVPGPRRLRVPDLTPSKSKRARSGTLSSALRVNRHQRRPLRKRTGGKPGTPPAPKNHGPVPGFPPDPHSCLPQTKHLAAQMTVENAGTGRAYRAAPGGHGNLQGNRGNREPPHSPVPRFPRTPSRPPPGPRARCARQSRLAHRADPGRHGNRHRDPPTPGPRTAQARAEVARTRRRGTPGTRAPPAIAGVRDRAAARRQP